MCISIQDRVVYALNFRDPIMLSVAVLLFLLLFKRTQPQLQREKKRPPPNWNVNSQKKSQYMCVQKHGKHLSLTTTWEIIEKFTQQAKKAMPLKKSLRMFNANLFCRTFILHFILTRLKSNECETGFKSNEEKKYNTKFIEANKQWWLKGIG